MSDKISKEEKNFEEFREELDKPLHWWIELYYCLYRILLKIREIPIKVKWFLQRGRRGFAECDVWNLQNYLSNLIASSVRELKEIQSGIPDEIWIKGKTEKRATSEWDTILERIIISFESLRDIDKISDMEMFDAKESAKIYKQVEKDAQVGLKLFIKYFNSLWD